MTTLLLPAGPLLAQGPTRPAFGLCWVEQEQETGLRSVAAADLRIPIVAGGLLPAEGQEGTVTFVDLLDDSADLLKAPSDAATAAFPASNAGAPWYRKRFVLLRTAGPCGAGPAAGGSPTAAQANARLVPPKEQAPGTVQNLRRADQR